MNHCDPIYLQVFSMTDHSQPVQQRYEGKYEGVNAKLHTSEVEQNILRVSGSVRTPKGDFDLRALEEAKVILSYRHSDTGILEGTSEQLFTLAEIPWTQLPGFEITEILERDRLAMKLWDHSFEVQRDRLYKVRFGNTLVLIRNFGTMDNVEITENPLHNGPLQLHADVVDEEITIAPAQGSAIVIKAGQETTN